MRIPLWLCSGLLVLTSGCFLRVPRNDGYAPARRQMTRAEAVDAGMRECRSRRLDCRLHEAHLKNGGDVWRVKLRAYRQGRKGHLHLDYDAWSRNLIRADAKLRPWRRGKPPRWNVDDDWDDDNDGVADRKERRGGHSASNPGSGRGHEATPPGQQKKDDKDEKKKKEKKEKENE